MEQIHRSHPLFFHLSPKKGPFSQSFSLLCSCQWVSVLNENAFMSLPRITMLMQTPNTFWNSYGKIQTNLMCSFLVLSPAVHRKKCSWFQISHFLPCFWCTLWLPYLAIWLSTVSMGFFTDRSRKGVHVKSIVYPNWKRKSHPLLLKYFSK